MPIVCPFAQFMGEVVLDDRPSLLIVQELLLDGRPRSLFVQEEGRKEARVTLSQRTRRGLSGGGESMKSEKCGAKSSCAIRWRRYAPNLMSSAAN